MYYFGAQELYEEGKYRDALYSLEKVNDILGKQNARTLSLEIKIRYELQEYRKAEELLNQLSQLKEADDRILKEISIYAVKIDKAIGRIEEQKRHAEEAQLKARRAQQQQDKSNFNKLNDTLKEMVREYKKFQRLVEERNSDKFAPYVSGEITKAILDREGAILGNKFAECSNYWRDTKKQECLDDVEKIRQSLEKKNQLLDDYKYNLVSLVASGNTHRMQLKKEGVELCAKLQGTEYQSRIKKNCDNIRKAQALVKDGGT
ncbi:MAG: hypothetical protein WA981_01270 [Glaciecola sp.]